MKNIQKVELNKLAKEELLPAFSTDFHILQSVRAWLKQLLRQNFPGKIRLYAIGIPQALAQS